MREMTTLLVLFDVTEYQAKKQKLVRQKAREKEKVADLKRGRTCWLELAKDIIPPCNSIGKFAEEKTIKNYLKFAKKQVRTSF